MCCGYGKMDDDMSIQQITQCINDYSRYKPHCIYKNIIINEPNLKEQPKIYQNTEFFTLSPGEIVTC